MDCVLDGGFVMAADVVFCMYPASEETLWEPGCVHPSDMPCPTQAGIIWGMPAMPEMPSFCVSECFRTVSNFCLVILVCTAGATFDA